MGCLYEDSEGVCTLSLDDDGLVDKDNIQQGCGDDGICVVSCDPNPGYSCECYESDYSCPDCGMDLNVEECTCGEENDTL